MKSWALRGLICAFVAIVVVGAIAFSTRGDETAGASAETATAPDTQDGLKQKESNDVRYESSEAAAADLRNVLTERVESVRTGSLSPSEGITSICRETDVVLGRDIGVSPRDKAYFDAQTAVLDTQTEAFAAIKAEAADNPLVGEWVDLVLRLKSMSTEAGPNLDPKAIPQPMVDMVQRLKQLNEELKITC